MYVLIAYRFIVSKSDIKVIFCADQKEKLNSPHIKYLKHACKSNSVQRPPYLPNKNRKIKCDVTFPTYVNLLSKRHVTLSFHNN